ncbi:hypothetical protein Mal4_13240 [Maioricimonas rarisocia]|uniref:Uncharacterized protein n=1 Tax=Maioricimonas rarisocia TaxID=2528026 RepID=A0A517Z3G9_9PLAN|nr:hypothetical protein Mal4_13240 [Maioricimonas rarisocia]
MALRTTVDKASCSQPRHRARWGRHSIPACPDADRPVGFQISRTLFHAGWSRHRKTCENAAFILEATAQQSSRPPPAPPRSLPGRRSRSAVRESDHNKEKADRNVCPTSAQRPRGNCLRPTLPLRRNGSSHDSRQSDLQPATSLSQVGQAFLPALTLAGPAAGCHILITAHQSTWASPVPHKEISYKNHREILKSS